jgi:hypothetical protein
MLYETEKPLQSDVGAGNRQTDRGGAVSVRSLAYQDSPLNEHARLWTYRARPEWMAASWWGELRQDKSVTPVGAV